ncbi:hypothetical protein Pcinc_011340 [Petrolisthes cinctipes]|uniref:C2H2-type domain-containing protein n=1 Tax=Petrolisthes cinctipes TaxID=88211 RepID=A0AAE1BT70_PETCI|nr:hypothetical protein Pcinc_039029 [Petrolisthes cinctipes]KAK3884386.1 hypothetical protein Pcinc_011340 [Petrolisthes cinctipes]
MEGGELAPITLPQPSTDLPDIAQFLSIYMSEEDSLALQEGRAVGQPPTASRDTDFSIMSLVSHNPNSGAGTYAASHVGWPRRHDLQASLSRLSTHPSSHVGEPQVFKTYPMAAPLAPAPVLPRPAPTALTLPTETKPAEVKRPTAPLPPSPAPSTPSVTPPAVTAPSTVSGAGTGTGSGGGGGTRGGSGSTSGGQDPGKRHVCEVCTKSFSRSDKLTLHRRTHTGEKPYGCFCGKRFARSDHLKIHAHKHKMNPEVRRSLLLEARKSRGPTTATSTTITSPSTTAPTPPSPVTPHQPRLVDASTQLGIGDSLLVKEEPDDEDDEEDDDDEDDGDSGIRQECGVCHKVFGSIYKLSRHLRTHTGEKPYVCFCGDRFSRSDVLRIHQKSKHYCSSDQPIDGAREGNVGHSGSTKSHNKPKKTMKSDGIHTCEYCSKEFKAGYKLTVHLRYHTGEKPYVCDFCGKGFARRDHMKKHRKIHSK